MNITRRNKFANRGHSVVKTSKRIPINYDIKVLDLMCAYTVSENAHIRKAGIINLRNLVNLLDLDLYINDPEKMKRLNVVLEEDLHTKLKITAFEQGKTMSQYVTDLLKREFEKKEKQEEQ